MKKFLIVILLLVLVPSLVFAAKGNKGNKSETNETVDDDATNGSDQIIDQNRTREKIRNVTEIKERVQERKQEMEREVESMSEKKQKVYRNQNLVRETVHNLLDMRDLLDQKGGIGQNVSEIAREFNNSVQSTIRAEESIQTRSRIIKYLIGGDSEAAEEIEQEVSMNRGRIQKLNQLKEQIKDDEELQQLLEEQIQQIEQEQNRLQELAEQEKSIRGLFGWLFR